MRLAAFLVASLLALAGCGSGDSAADGPEPVGSGAAGERRLAEIRAAISDHAPVEGIRERPAGEGSRGAIVLWSEQLATPPRDVIVFLHGWHPLLSSPSSYGDWVAHLAERGSAIVFPTYLPPDGDPERAPENVLAGVAAGLDALGAGPESLVVAGHTTGGALAFDYAAGAADAGLPLPDAILAVYPGRNPNRWIPAIDPAGIAPRTRIAVLSGEGNPVVEGEGQARHLLRTARRVPPQRRRYVDVDPAARPTGSDAPTRRAVWRPLDRLIEVARREARERK